VVYLVCRGVTTRRQGAHNSPGARSLWERRITAGDGKCLLREPKSPNNVTSAFFNTVNFLPNDLRFEHGGAKLASCPGRRLTSLRPCSYVLCFSHCSNSLVLIRFFQSLTVTLLSMERSSFVFKNFKSICTGNVSTWYASSHQLSMSFAFVKTAPYSQLFSECSVNAMDLWFLIDGSGSVGSGNFQKTLDFVALLSSEFNISSDGVRTGLSVFNNANQIISRFDQHQSKEAFNSTVQTTRYPGGKVLFCLDHKTGMGNYLLSRAA